VVWKGQGEGTEKREDGGQRVVDRGMVRKWVDGMAGAGIMCRDYPTL